MKAVVVHQYGGPEVLKFEDYPDPVPGPGEVLVRVAATSVNPIDYKQRAGLTKDFYPIHFPGLTGVDMSGTVVKIGPGADGFSVGDQVFAMTDYTYAELCVVRTAVLARIPKGLGLIQAAALPLVTITGNQLLSATGIKAGQTVMVLGAIGNVGRSAVFTAKECGAIVIAGVLKSQIVNFRVADIQACYELWKSRGAEFITEPIPKYGEIRCYIRDPDGYIIEVGQSTDLKYG